MIYLGPEKTFENKGTGRQFRGRVLYADTKAELYEVLIKLGRPFKGIRKDPWRYLLSSGYAWQLIRIRDDGFVEFEEIGLLREREMMESRQGAKTQRK